METLAGVQLGINALNFDLRLPGPGIIPGMPYLGNALACDGSAHLKSHLPGPHRVTNVSHVQQDVAQQLMILGADHSNDSAPAGLGVSELLQQAKVLCHIRVENHVVNQAGDLQRKQSRLCRSEKIPEL